jgi:hypothetical protein
MDSQKGNDVMKIKELEKLSISNETFQKIMFFKRQLRDIRILVSNARQMKHRVSQDTLYQKALALIEMYFFGQFCIPSTIGDRLTWPRDKTNRMTSHPTPKLKGI